MLLGDSQELVGFGSRRDESDLLERHFDVLERARLAPEEAQLLKLALVHEELLREALVDVLHEVLDLVHGAGDHGVRVDALVGPYVLVLERGLRLVLEVRILQELLDLFIDLRLLLAPDLFLDLLLLLEFVLVVFLVEDTLIKHIPVFRAEDLVPKRLLKAEGRVADEGDLRLDFAELLDGDLVGTLDVEELDGLHVVEVEDLLVVALLDEEGHEVLFGDEVVVVAVEELKDEEDDAVGRVEAK